MHKHEQKNCPRCSNLFECKAGDITHCQCMEVTLTLEEKTFIEARYVDCLCGNCLREIKNKYTLFKEKFLHNGR